MVLCAVSGGADSMALLSVLLFFRAEFGMHLRAAHVNHCLRGEQSLRDETFVRESCEKYAVPLDVLRVDVAAKAKESGEGLEECGRRLRYAFFASLDDKARVATAHTQSDRLESMLLNLTRGTGLSGLCPIAPVRGQVIRPLLDCSRAQVEVYCAGQGIAFMTDSSNADTVFRRNRIRAEVIPVLRGMNPALDEAASRCFNALERDADFLKEQTQQLLCKATDGEGYSAKLLLEAHPALRSRALLALLWKYPDTANARNEAALTQLLETGGKIQIGKALFAVCESGLLHFVTRTRKEDGELPSAVPLCLGTLPFGSRKLHCGTIHKTEIEKIQKIHKEQLASCLDYDTIIGNSFFRTRQAGDVLRLAGSNSSKQVRRLFQEKHFSPEKRGRLAVLADEMGVVWAEGCGCADRCKITPQTQTVLRILPNEEA